MGVRIKLKYVREIVRKDVWKEEGEEEEMMRTQSKGRDGVA